MDSELSAAEYFAALAFGAVVALGLIKLVVWDRLVRPRLWGTSRA